MSITTDPTPETDVSFASHVPFKGFNKDRGFTHHDLHSAAEELRSEHGESKDPIYKNSQKNKGGKC